MVWLTLDFQIPGVQECSPQISHFEPARFVVADCDSSPEKLKQSLNPFPISGVPNLRGTMIPGELMQQYQK